MWLFLLILLGGFPMLAFAQIQDRYLAQCRYTLSAGCLGTGFYRASFSETPRIYRTPRPHYTSCRYVVPVTFTTPADNHSCIFLPKTSFLAWGCATLGWSCTTLG